MYLLQIFNTVVPLLTIPYITRVLNKEQYGKFSIALNLIGYFEVIIEYGFSMSATRKLTLIGKNKDRINRLLTTVLYSRFILFSISISLLQLYMIIFEFDGIEKKCIYLLSLSLVGGCFQQNWLYQGLQEMKYISLINILARGISTILIFILVKSPNDLFLYCILYSSVSMIAGLGGFIFAFIKYQIRVVGIKIKNILYELKDGWYVFTTQLSSKIFGSIGITLLGIFGTSSDVGELSVLQKIPNILILIWAPIGQVLYPIVSQNFNESVSNGKKFVMSCKKVILPIFILLTIVGICFSKRIVLIVFGENYLDSYFWIIPLFMWVVIAINNNFLGIQTLLASGHDKEYSKCFQIGVFCTIILNFILVIIFKGMGAAIAPLLSELVLTYLLSIETLKVFKEKN